MDKKIIFIFLVAAVLIGSIGFLYYRSKVFSKEILKLEVLSQETAKMGDEIEYNVKYKNNGNFVLENPKLIFELPENSITEDGKTRSTQNLEDIYPGEEDIIKFRGYLFGKEGDLKTARAWLSYKPRNLSARYESETSFTTKIESVPFTLAYDLPSKAEKGKEVAYSINYFSNVNYPLENLSIKIEPLQGFSIKSAEPSSLDNSEWKLSTLTKGKGGRINIRGMILSDAPDNFTFSMRLGLWRDGSFIVIKEVSQDISVIQTAQIELSQKVYHSSVDGIENSGPIPPKVSQTTTYIVVWRIKDYLSGVKNLKVKTVLPQNVFLADAIFPESQATNFSFDSQSREIVWLAGDLLAGEDIRLSFQIAFTPNLSQQGRLADLISQATVFGEDTLTGTPIQVSALSVNTSLPDDKENSGGGIIK